MTDEVTISIREPARAVDVVHRVPVLVVGGGPSGLAAAIAAARAGRDEPSLDQHPLGRDILAGGSRPERDHTVESTLPHTGVSFGVIPKLPSR